MGKSILAGVGLLLVAAAILLISSSAYIVRETEQVIITQFGEPKGEKIDDAGLHFKLPFVQKVNRIQKQILEWDGQRTEMPTRDKLYISVDTFARWRIEEPLQYFEKLRDERSAQSRLDDILGSETRNAIAKHDLIEVIRTTKGRTPQVDEFLEVGDANNNPVGVLNPIRKGRKLIEVEIQDAARSKLAEFGIELLDVRFKRINYNPSVVKKIYGRMISERQQIASRFRSEGEGEAAKILGSRSKELDSIQSEAYRRVQEIQGAADAVATGVYARAYDQTPEARELYDFVKSMETYRKVIDRDSTMVFSTESELFRFLNNADGKD